MRKRGKLESMEDLQLRTKACKTGVPKVRARQSATMPSSQREYHVLPGWCGREDLNLHTPSGTCTSSMRVCQFRHDRKHPNTELVQTSSHSYFKLTRLPITIGPQCRRWPPVCRQGLLNRERARMREIDIYMTASLVRCQSIVQVSCNQLVRTFPLPRYLEKWVRRETRFLVSY